MTNLQTLLERLPLRGPGLRWGATLVLAGLLGLLLLVLGRILVPPLPGGAARGTLGLGGTAGLVSAGTGGTAGGADAGAVGQAGPGSASDPVRAAEEELETRLEAALSRIQGAGRVSVVVTLSASDRLDFARQTRTSRQSSQEKGSDGSVQTTAQETSDEEVALAQGAAGQEPVLTQASRAEVQGVLVVAEGASNPAVRAVLLRAVEVGLGVPGDRVIVVPGKGK